MDNLSLGKIESLPEFDDHKFVIFIQDRTSGLKGFIVVHRGGVKIPSLGATRLWSYESEIEALRDALRLSRMMSYKSAMAGLKYGGAKAVLMARSMKKREDLFKSYAQKVNYLGGKFITGTDVGVGESDLRMMKAETKHVIGNDVDPAHYTAIGVLSGIHAALKFKFGDPRIGGKSFAIQGIGKTGAEILGCLHQETKKIIVADIDQRKIKWAKEKFPQLRVVSPERIHSQDVDVFVPCALGGALSAASISEMRVKIVAGSANNQLEGERIGNLLFKFGIVYAPDYVINAGGLISVADELENEHPNAKRILKRVEKIGKTLTAIFNKSRRQKKATNIVANSLAEKIFNNLHRS